MVDSRTKVLVAIASIIADLYTILAGNHNEFTYCRILFGLLIVAAVFFDKSFYRFSLWHVSIFLGITMLIGSALSLLAVYLNMKMWQNFPYVEFILVGVLYAVGGVILVLPDSKK